MQEEIIISWFATDSNNTVKDEHRQALEESAEKRIKEMMSDGFVAGEIVEHIQAEKDDGALYTGWWSVEKRVLQ